MSDEHGEQYKSDMNGCLTVGCSGLLLMALVAVMVPVLFPVIFHRHPASQRTDCLNNLKQIGIGINMYMQDWNNQLPPVSGFGPELDHHTAMWGVQGDALNQWGSNPKYLPELIGPYVKNTKIFTCPAMEDTVWEVPRGMVDFSKNGTSYIYNAWCMSNKAKKFPNSCIKISGRNAKDCADPSGAPIVWDGMSGYGLYAHDDSVCVLYLDSHVKGEAMSIAVNQTFWQVYAVKGPGCDAGWK